MSEYPDHNQTAIDKICSMCRERKPLADFWLHGSGQYHSYCKPCDRAYKRRPDIREKARARDRLRYEARKGEQKRAYHAKYMRKYRENSLVKSAELARRKKYSQYEHAKMLARAAGARRRAIKRSAVVDRVTSADLRQLMNLQKGRCAVCRKSIKRKYHVDHITPLSRGGAHARSNLQLTCPNCNQKKHAKDPIDFMREMGYLI